MNLEDSKLERRDKYLGPIRELQENLAQLLYEIILAEVKQKVEVVPKLDQEVIRKKVQKEAQKICAELLDIAFDIDENINALLKNPRVLKKYDYDGNFFTPKGGFGFHRVIDGVNSLTSLDNNIRSYFWSRNKIQAIAEIIESATKLREEAEAALSNWKEYGVVSAINPGLVREILEFHQSRIENKISNMVPVETEPPELKEEERIFLREYEEQMEKPNDSTNKKER